MPERADLQLALCESEEIAKAVVAYSDDTPSVLTVRSYRNAIMAVAPDPSGLEKSIQRIERLMAAEAIEGEITNTEAGKLAREQLKKIKPQLIKSARLEAARTFNRLALADGSVLPIDERFIMPPDSSPMHLPSGQDAVRGFVEDRQLIYGTDDSLDPQLFVDRVFSGAVPAKELSDARTTASLQKRFVSAQGLRLVGDPSVMRASILRAVTQGLLVVRQEDGTTFDKDGAVYVANGKSQRDNGRKLTTLPMDDTTLVVEAGSALAKQWLTVFSFSDQPTKPFEIPLPPPPPKGAGATSTADINTAGELADKRRLLSLRVTCSSAADAQKVLAAAAPMGAPAITIEGDLTGDMKDGGKLALRVADAKLSAAIKPLALAQMLGNSLEPGSSIRVTIGLSFGSDGKPDLGSLLRGLALQLPEGATIEARFAPLSV